MNKLGEAPRAYFDKLVAAESNPMSDVSNHGSKLSLNERFEKIQGARITNGNRGQGKTLRLIPRPKVANRKY